MPDIQYSSSQNPWPLEAKYGNCDLCFSATFDPSRAGRIKTKKALERTVLTILFAVSVIGLAEFYFKAYQAFVSKDINLLLRRDIHSFAFAVSVYSDLYLWSHQRRARYIKRNNSLATLGSRSGAKTLDIYSFFDEKAKAVWDNIAVLARDTNTVPNSAAIIQSLLADREVQMALTRLRVNYLAILDDLGAVKMSPVSPVEQEFLYRLPFEAFAAALEMRARSVSSLAVLYAFIKTIPRTMPLSSLFRAYGLEAESLEAVCSWDINLDILDAEYKDIHRFSKYKTLDTNKGLTSVPTPYLNQFSVDLTAQAKYGRLPLSYGRQADLEEVLKLFSEKIRFIAVKGAEGTGRSTVLNELAYKMVSEEVPPLLQDKRLVKLEISSIIGSRVNPEEVLQNALKEAERNDNIILAIEDIHMLAKAEGAHGLNLLQVLLGFFQESNLMAVATTNPSDYLDSLRPQGGFDQLFSVFELQPLPFKAIIQSACVKATILENRYKMFFTYDALKAAVELTSEYAGQQGQPQAAIAILTEVASRLKGDKKAVTKEDVEKAFSEKSHIPTASLNVNESSKILNLEKDLSTQVIGQKQAIVAVSNAIKRSRSGLSTGNRPIGSFLFVGPTGVGKTELAKSLARIYFGDEKYFLRLDMSEYQGEGGLEKLLGSQNSQSQFVKHIKDYPFCLLLLDEFEKASREVWNLFLQILDDGRITTTSGETLSLKNTIIIATSNAGTADIQSGLKQGLAIEQIKSGLLNDILFKIFAPELLNRFDDVILFSPLAPEDVRQIAGLFLSGLAAKLKQSKDIDFTFSDEALGLIAERGYDPALGARPIRRFVQDHVDTLIAETLLKNNLTRGSRVNLEVKQGELVLDTAA